MIQEIWHFNGDYYYGSHYNQSGNVVMKKIVKGEVSKKEKIFVDDFANWKKVEGAKVKMVVRIPTKFRKHLDRERIIKEARRAVYDILTTGDQKHKDYLALLAMRSCMFVKDKDFFTLKDFCSDIKLKKTHLLFNIISNYLGRKYKGKENAVEALSDTILTRTLDHYNAYWNCWYGFNKYLDRRLLTDLKIYEHEFQRRNKA